MLIKSAYSLTPLIAFAVLASDDGFKAERAHLASVAILAGDSLRADALSGDRVAVRRVARCVEQL